ncbi:MAG TPA: hypothetical protein VMU64_15175 [Acidimicrobiales bacterium]|nr:hypothetical protein [Acidimicrobiales bacterium]
MLTSTALSRRLWVITSRAVIPVVDVLKPSGRCGPGYGLRLNR